MHSDGSKICGPPTMKYILLLALVSSCQPLRRVSEDGLRKLFYNHMMLNETAQDRSDFEDVIQIYRHVWRESKMSDSLRSPGMTNRVWLKWFDCAMCKAGMSSLFTGFALFSDAQLAGILTPGCTVVTSYTTRVCRGVLERALPVIRYVEANTPEATASTFCALMLQSDEKPSYCALEDQRFNWTVKLPWRKERRSHSFLRYTVDSNASKGLKIALVTDPHVDMQYQPFTEANCDEPICCRENLTRKERHVQPKMTMITTEMFIANGSDFLIDLDAIEDARLNGKEYVDTVHDKRLQKDTSPAGFWGDYRKCDTPKWSFENALDEVSRNQKDLEMVYYVGDSVDHFIWHTSHESVTRVQSYVLGRLRAAFGPTPIVPVVGNHEAHPVNQFAPSHVTGPLNTTWLYEFLANKWAPYLDEDALTTFRERGDFAMTIRPDFKVISLNNNVANNFNWWLVHDPWSPKRHLDWLVLQLWQAELMGQRVHILAHIPPGHPDLIQTWSREYSRIVQRFASTIAAEFNGHTHSDEFKLFYDKMEVPVATAWNGGGITTYTDFNLNYKTISLDPYTYAVSDMQTFVYNLTEANLSPEKKPRWFQLYELPGLYQLQDLQPASLGQLVERMVTSEKYLLDVYHRMYTKSSAANVTCDAECKLKTICYVVITELWDESICNRLMQKYAES